MPTVPQHQLEPSPEKLTSQAPRLRRQLLDWWQVHGRLRIEQKPWMFATGGRFPDAGESLPPFGIWCAEVMRAARQHRLIGPMDGPSCRS
jgi:A/G-specific adenine glycosylase